VNGKIPIQDARERLEAENCGCVPHAVNLACELAFLGSLRVPIVSYEIQASMIHDVKGVCSMPRAYKCWMPRSVLRLLCLIHPSADRVHTRADHVSH